MPSEAGCGKTGFLLGPWAGLVTRRDQQGLMLGCEEGRKKAG